MEKTEDPAVEMTRKILLSLAKLTTALTTANNDIAELARALIPATKPPPARGRRISLVYLDPIPLVGNLGEKISKKFKSLSIDVRQLSAGILPDRDDIVILVAFTTRYRYTWNIADSAIQNIGSGVDVIGIIFLVNGPASALLPMLPLVDDSPPLVEIALPVSGVTLPVWQLRFDATGVIGDATETRLALSQIATAITTKLRA